MPGLNEKNPVLNGQVSHGEDLLEIAGCTNRVGIVEAVTTKYVIASIAACRISAVVCRLHDIAE